MTKVVNYEEKNAERINALYNMGPLTDHGDNDKL